MAPSNPAVRRAPINPTYSAGRVPARVTTSTQHQRLSPTPPNDDPPPGGNPNGDDTAIPDFKQYAVHIRRLVTLFGDLTTLMAKGILRDTHTDEDEPIPEHDLISDEDFETYKDDGSKLEALSRKLTKAADDARNNDNHRLKYMAPSAMSSFVMEDTGETYPLVESSAKDTRGFSHPATGLHLCPVSLDWYEKDEENPEQYPVRQMLRRGEYTLDWEDLPGILYRNCKSNPDVLSEGCLLNDYVIDCAKAILNGPTSVFTCNPGGRTTKKGNAARVGLKTVTPRLVAYVTCLARFSLSTLEHWDSMDGDFDMEGLYSYIVIDLLGDKECDFYKTVIATWNQRVLGIAQPPTSAPTVGQARKRPADLLLEQQREAQRRRAEHRTDA